MIFKKKGQIPKALLTAQELIGIEEISDDILYTREKIIFAYISVRAMGDSLLTHQEKEIACTKIVHALEKEKKCWQLLSMPRVMNTRELINHLISLKNNAENDARIKLIDGEIDAVQNMARSGAKEPMIIIKLWEKEDKSGEKTLNARVSDILNRLKSVNGITAQRLKDPDIAFICKQLSELGAPQQDEEPREMPAIKGRRNNSIDIDLINELTPLGGIDIKVNYLTIGDTKARIYGVSSYPRTEFDYGWLTDIMNNTEAVTCLTFEPVNAGIAGDALSKSVRRTTAEVADIKDVREGKALARKAADADKMLDELDENHETIGMLNILTMPFASNDADFEEVCNRVISLFANHRIRLKLLGQLQKEAFMSLAPYSTPSGIVRRALDRLVPLFTLIGGSPMCINSYQDKNGFYFAKTSTGNIVAIDMWYRGQDRTNSNMFILGKAGRGKSTIIKHIAQIEYMRGTKIIFIDPESEYAEITELLGGSVFNAGGGDAKINIFHVRSSADDDSEEDTKDKLYGKSKGNILAMHLNNLDSFFRLYLEGASEMHFSALEKATLDLYERFGMSWTTDYRNIPAHKFPIMLDLYNYLNEQSNTVEIYKDIAARISSAAIGKDSFIFNGHTNIDLSADVQCYDTKALQSSSDKIKRAQYYNLLGLGWEIMSADMEQNVLLVCDEGYLLVDPELPQSLMLLRNIEKRCRKVNGGLAFVTHSAVDLLHKSIQQYGQAIMDIPDYKLFLNADGQNLKEITRLYDLTEKQQDILRKGGRGEALCMLGSTMLHLNFELPQYKLDNMGRGGGR